MIAEKSSSYPILAAARAAGVDYGLALEYAWCLVWCFAGTERRDDAHDRWLAVREAVEARHGRPARRDLFERLDDALCEERISHKAIA